MAARLLSHFCLTHHLQHIATSTYLWRAGIHFKDANWIDCPQKSKRRCKYSLAVPKVSQPSYCFWTQKCSFISMSWPPISSSSCKESSSQWMLQDNHTTDPCPFPLRFHISLWNCLQHTGSALWPVHFCLSLLLSHKNLKLANLKYWETYKVYWTVCQNLLLGKNESLERFLNDI